MYRVENKLMGNKLAVMKIKSNDLVMNLARHRYLLIVHTEGLCLLAAGVAFEMEEYKDRRQASIERKEAQAVQSFCGNWVR